MGARRSGKLGSDMLPILIMMCDCGLRLPDCVIQAGIADLGKIHLNPKSEIRNPKLSA
jgi:hypothetical protein